MIIGKKGDSVNKLRVNLQNLTQKKVKIDVREITKPELDSRLVAESIAEQLVRRISWKRAMKQAAQKTLHAGGKGIMITLSGRLVAVTWAVSTLCAKGRFRAIHCVLTSTGVKCAGKQAEPGCALRPARMLKSMDRDRDL